MALTAHDNVNVLLPKDLLLRIQAKSEMPALEGLIGILKRILDEHDNAHPNRSKQVILTVLATQQPKFFKTSRGFELPIGLDLFADYDGSHVTAKVSAGGIEYKGKTYDVSPSAFAAKKDCGASDSAAPTNGWKFWMYKNGDQALLIDAFRK